MKSKINLSISKATKSSIELIQSLGGNINILETPKTKRNRKVTKKTNKTKIDENTSKDNEVIENDDANDNIESQNEDNTTEDKEGS